MELNLIRKIFLITLIFYIRIPLIGQILPESFSVDSQFFSINEALKNPQKVRTLDLTDENLSNIDWDVNEFKNLDALIINKSTIKYIPESILNNKTIKLFCFGNNISLLKLPYKIFNIPSLVELMLNGTVVTQIDDSIEKSSTLRFLYITNCNLNSLPKSFSKLCALNELYAIRNNFLRIPESIFKCQSLEVLNLSFCPIMDLNLKSFKKLKHLKKLILVGTNIPNERFIKLQKYLPSDCILISHEPD